MSAQKATTVEAHSAEAAAYLDDAPDHHLRCRTLGHAWEPGHDGYLVEGTGAGTVWLQQLQCLRCATGRTDELAPYTLELIGRRYQHAEGFLATGTEGRITRQEARQAIARRAERRQSRRLRSAG
jgi:hypothetical protein